MLFNLGAALETRNGLPGEPADLAAAIASYQAAVGVVAAAPRVRAAAARSWGRAAAAGDHWEEAIAGFTRAIELIGQVTPRSLTRKDQEALLAEMGGLGADAAACCVQAGLVDRAVELFEQGRGVLLGQALDARTDLTALTEQRPTLATSFIRLLDVLNEVENVEQAHPTPVHSTLRTASDERRAAGATFIQLIAEIRQLDGFDGFLRPPPVAELLAAAADGPVVAVAVSQFGSHALLMTGSGVEAVALPDLTPQTVHDQVSAFVDALADATSAAAQWSDPDLVDSRREVH
jgi:hypothetical protein